MPKITNALLVFLISTSVITQSFCCVFNRFNTYCKHGELGMDCEICKTAITGDREKNEIKSQNPKQKYHSTRHSYGHMDFEHPGIEHAIETKDKKTKTENFQPKSPLLKKLIFEQK